jgi:trafficking protein particle complex subunit 2
MVSSCAYSYGLSALSCGRRFLKVVDRFNSLLVSGYVTPGGTVMLLLHNGRGEDQVRAFFVEVNDLYTKYLMNPFSTPDAPIVSAQFDFIVRGLAKRILGL